MAGVRFEDLSKTFPGRGGGDPVEVIRQLNLTINDGEFLVLVGPSGCGKSTLLRLLAGLDNPSNGEIRIGTRPISDVPPARRNVAMVFQSYALYPHMTVYNNMAFSLDLQGVPKKEIRDRVEAAAKILQMETLLDRRPAALSGGQRQRVAIGRAIVRNPDVFLFDEPLSNLDAALRHDTRVEIARLHAQLGATTIYVTHDQVEAMTLADKIVVLKAGEVMQVGAPMELFNKPANEFVAGFLGSPSMNFFQGSLSGKSDALDQGQFSGSGIETGDVRLVSTEKSIGDAVKLGIRPQHLVLDDKGPLEGTVSLVERLGTDTIVELMAADNTLFRFATAEAINLTSGDTVRFAYDHEKVHIF